MACKQSELVSVIIPTFNRECFLAEAVESVLAQSYPSVELIVVDDGSTDGTQELLSRWEGRIRSLRTDRGGPAHARNAGIRAATGAYLAFLDSDDFYEPFKLALQVGFLRDRPEIGMVYTEFSGLYQGGELDRFHLRSYLPTYFEQGWSYDDLFGPAASIAAEAPATEVSAYSGSLFPRILLGPLISSPTMMLRRGVIEDVGLQDENMQLGEDYEYTVRICRSCGVGFLNVPTYVHRYHEGQINPFAEGLELSREEGLLKQIECYEALLQTVQKWGKGDGLSVEDRDLVERRLSTLERQLGEKWLFLPDIGKARAHFRKAQAGRGLGLTGRLYWCLTLVPDLARRTVMKIVGKMRHWGFLLKKRQMQ